jgi:hypothetical protein
VGRPLNTGAPIARARNFWKSSLTGWLIAIPVWLALVTLDHGKGAAFMKAHFWTVCVLPLVVLFLILFVRAYYIQYKR